MYETGVREPNLFEIFCHLEWFQMTRHRKPLRAYFLFLVRCFAHWLNTEDSTIDILIRARAGLGLLIVPLYVYKYVQDKFFTRL
jgi:hypothetical protein